VSVSSAAPGLRAGLAATTGAYTLWGLTPLFYKLFTAVPNMELVAHRALWAAPAAALAALALTGADPVRRALRDGRAVAVLAAASLLMGANWSIYIWAINTDRVLEASLGYYINPLITVALGVVALGERLRPLQIAAVGAAALGVLTLTLAAGRAPALGLGLAATFAVYGYLKKRLRVDPAAGLCIEMALLSAPAALIISVLYAQGAPDRSPGFWALIALTGPASVAPLILFAIGAQRLRLTTLGLMQYLAPTIMFGLSLAFGEPFSPAHAIAFGLIWAGLAAFTLDARRAVRSL